MPVPKGAWWTGSLTGRRTKKPLNSFEIANGKVDRTRPGIQEIDGFRFMVSPKGKIEGLGRIKGK